ncbi:MAG: sensor histidine kinase [Polyangiales bacterium]
MSCEEVLASLPLEIALHDLCGTVFRHGDAGAAPADPFVVEIEVGLRLSIRAPSPSGPQGARRAVSVFLIRDAGALRHLWGPPIRLSLIQPASFIPVLAAQDPGTAGAALVGERAGRHEERALLALLPLPPTASSGARGLLLVEAHATLAPDPAAAGPADLDVAGARHRLRNHLQALLGAVRLQRAGESDDAARHALDRVLVRLDAVHRVHSILDDDRVDAGAVAFATVARALVEAQTAIFPGRVTLAADLAPVTLPRNEALLLARVLAELVGNALLHAFGARGEGRLWISFHAAGEAWIMTVRDDGSGWRGAGGDPEARLGLTLVRRMVDDLRGTFTLTQDQGVTATVRVPTGALRG